MPTEQNKTQGNNPKTTGASGGTAAGMQVSGEQIFTQSDVDKKSVSAQDAQDAFGASSNQPKQPKQTGGGQPNQTADQITSQVGEVLRGNTSGVKEVLNQAKETTTQAASQAFGQVQEKAGTAITEGKQTFAQGLTGLAEGIRQLSGNLRGQEQQNQVVSTAANYVEPLAGQIENIAHYLERQDLRGLSRDLQNFARRNPTLFVAGAFGLGLLAARFLKSSPRQELMVRNRANQTNFTDFNTYSDTDDDVKTKTTRSTGKKTPGGTIGTSGTTGTTPGASIS